MTYLLQATVTRAGLPPLTLWWGYVRERSLSNTMLLQIGSRTRRVGGWTRKVGQAKHYRSLAGTRRALDVHSVKVPHPRDDVVLSIMANVGEDPS